MKKGNTLPYGLQVQASRLQFSPCSSQIVSYSLSFHGNHLFKLFVGGHDHEEKMNWRIEIDARYRVRGSRNYIIIAKGNSNPIPPSVCNMTNWWIENWLFNSSQMVGSSWVEEKGLVMNEISTDPVRECSLSQSRESSCSSQCECRGCVDDLPWIG